MGVQGQCKERSPPLRPCLQKSETPSSPATSCTCHYSFYQAPTYCHLGMSKKTKTPAANAETPASKYLRFCLDCDPKMRCKSSARKSAAGPCDSCGETNDYFSCPKCSVCKPKQNTMYYHMSKCMGSTKYKCEHCTFMAVQQATLDLHIQSKHPEHAEKTLEQFCCPWPQCPFKSLTAGNLRIHFLRIHFASKCSKVLERDDAGDYCCGLCSKDFKNSTHFYYHIGPCLIEHDQLNMMQEQLVTMVI